jgi:hypothetical protein
VSTAKSRNFVDRHFVGNAAQGAALRYRFEPAGFGFGDSLPDAPGLIIVAVRGIARPNFSQRDTCSLTSTYLGYTWITERAT